MSQFTQIIKELKKQEKRLVAQLANIRAAISSLEFGGGGVPPPAIIETPQAVRPRQKGGRTMSAGAPPVSERMKKHSPTRRAAKK